MALEVRPETEIDVAETARLANEAFGSSFFTPARLAWLYGGAFSGPAEVLGLFEGSRKVGQVAMLRQRLRCAGRDETAIALVDLFILKAFRSREAIGGLYGAVERLCRARGWRFLLAVPNAKAAGVNQRFLGMRPFAPLDIRVGVGMPFAGRLRASVRADALGRAEGEALLAPFAPSPEADGIAWTAAELWRRLQEPAASYGLHATDDLLLVSSQRVSRRVPHTVICALLPRAGARPTPRDVRAAIAGACRLHRRPPFIYAGLNRAVPLPGLRLPDRLRPSPMVVQIRDFAEGAAPPVLDRFELIDFDFA